MRILGCQVCTCGWLALQLLLFQPIAVAPLQVLTAEQVNQRFPGYSLPSGYKVSTPSCVDQGIACLNVRSFRSSMPTS